jgi:geranylgeranyl reductase family protein
VITCDALVVGGGPAGSSCAWKLRQAGMDVLVVDKATFPRDKVCAGWITPEVITELQIDVEDYRQGRTFQPITAFRVGVLGRRDVVDIDYRLPVSFGIRRCEFDHYLLERSGARVVAATPVAAIRRDNLHWIVNDEIRAPLVVGAGGHFCPVARMLNPDAVAAPLVAAQEGEFVAAPPASWPTDGERPELYFCADLRGYGWCFRKGEYLNVGFGRFDARALPKATSSFVDYLKANGRVPLNVSWRWRGHAYLVSGARSRKAVGDGVMLVGDAAGLAYPQSGEGIRPAIESGLMAASTILKAKGPYTVDRLTPYANRLRDRYGTGRLGRILSGALPDRTATRLAPRLMRNRWFVQHLVLDRWFLHRTGSRQFAAL